MTLKRWITDNKLMYKQVAKELDVTTTYVWQIANGYVKCGHKLAQRIEQLTRGQVQAQDLMSDASKDMLTRKTRKSAPQKPTRSRLALAWDWVQRAVFEDLK